MRMVRGGWGSHGLLDRSLILPHAERPGERGAALLEFVLVISLLILMLFAIVDFALLLNAKLVVTAAAREGARRAAVDGGASRAAYERVEDQLRLGRIDPEAARVDIWPERAAYGSLVRVRVEYDYPLMTPTVRALAGRAITLRADMVSRSEKVR